MNADMCSNDGNVKQHRFKRCSEEMDRARFSFTRGFTNCGDVVPETTLTETKAFL
jgi:hypothetical protein